MTTSEHTRGLLAVLAAGILWSTGGLLIKWVNLPPLAITAWRSFFAALVFFALFYKTIFTTNRRMWLNSVFYALTLLSFVTATKLTTAANAIFLQFTAPIYILLLEPRFFKIPLRREDILVVLFCLMGMALFFVGDFNFGNMLGNVTALFSGLCYAAFVLGQRLNKPETHFSAIFWGNIMVITVSAIAILGFGLQFWSGPTEFAMLAFLGIFQIGFAYALFTFGLQRTLAIEASMISFAEPILNPIWVWIGYGEKPSDWALLGGLIIVISLLVWTLFKTRSFEK